MRDKHGKLTYPILLPGFSTALQPGYLQYPSSFPRKTCLYQSHRAPDPWGSLNVSLPNSDTSRDVQSLCDMTSIPQRQYKPISLACLRAPLMCGYHQGPGVDHDHKNSLSTLRKPLRKPKPGRSGAYRMAGSSFSAMLCAFSVRHDLLTHHTELMWRSPHKHCSNSLSPNCCHNRRYAI